MQVSHHYELLLACDGDRIRIGSLLQEFVCQAKDLQDGLPTQPAAAPVDFDYVVHHIYIINTDINTMGKLFTL